MAKCDHLNLTCGEICLSFKRMQEEKVLKLGHKREVFASTQDNKIYSESKFPNYTLSPYLLKERKE